jgi:hypothetical protein
MNGSLGTKVRASAPLEWWLSAHRRFFGRQAAAQGFRMHDEIETIFERFEIVWPPEIADVSRPAGGATRI